MEIDDSLDYPKIVSMNVVYPFRKCYQLFPFFMYERSTDSPYRCPFQQKYLKVYDGRFMKIPKDKNQKMAATVNYPGTLKKFVSLVSEFETCILILGLLF